MQQIHGNIYRYLYNCMLWANAPNGLALHLFRVHWGVLHLIALALFYSSEYKLKNHTPPSFSWVDKK